MPEPTTPVAPQAGDPGVTPAPAATITSPEPQAGEGNINEPLSLEEAKKLRSEAQALRKREKDVLAQLKTYQDAEQAQKDAQLSEVEKANKQYADAQDTIETLASELLEMRVFRAVSQEASKLNFILPTDMLTKLLLNDLDSIEFDNGKPTNIEKLLTELAKSTPDLIKPEPAPVGTPGFGAPVIPAMNPGRSQIVQPGQQPGGRIPRITDPGLWKGGR
jgi:hypothetical protein